eukprot:TRINITY_DN1008_c0_g1_i1.p1 TRINITY_DN1008_c0_g1~~TRINITY_DN1008_c0_g1_i1.p1  ORF type:complete len:934 (-),score=352.59 TRINITY_DN1008_c0_g1_i1:403-3204(-)
MSSKSGDRDKPLALITVENGKFVVHDEALKRISAIQGPVGVIAIAGLYRSGKSYVMNRLLGRQHGFEVGPTINACTKGIYVWGEPLVIKGADGENVSYILIDTEGLGSMEQSQTYDAKIFSLAILFSSYFIYNSMGVIDETAIDKLSLVTNLTKHIHISEGHIERSAAAFAEYFPHFVWLVRDFSLQLVDTKGHAISARQYLDNALAIRSSDPSKNQIRDTIMQAFPGRDCYTLVRPVIDESKLQAIDRIAVSELRPEFRTQIDQFKNKVFLEAGAKKIAGRKLNGQAVAGMIVQYVTAINSGRIPTIASAWENVVEGQNRKAVVEAVAAFKAAIRSSFKELPVEDSELSKANDGCQKKARDLYYKMSMGDTHATYIAELEGQMAEEYAKLAGENRAASEKGCKALLVKLFETIEKKVKNKAYVEQSEFDQDAQDFWKSYARQAKGPSRDASRIEFEQGTLALARASVTAQLHDRARKELDEQRKRAADAEKRAVQVEREKEQQASAHREAALKADHQLDVVRRELSTAQKEVADLKAKLDSSRKKADAEIASLTKARDDFADKLQKEKDAHEASRRDKASRDADVTRLQHQLAELKASLEVERKAREHVNAELHQQREAAKTLSDQKDGQTKLKSEVERKLAQAESSLAASEKELARTTQSLANSEKSLAKREKDLANAAQELAKAHSDLSASRNENDRLARLQSDHSRETLESSQKASREFESLQRDMKTAASEHKAALAQRDATIASLRGDLKSAEAQRGSRDDQLERLREELQRDRRAADQLQRASDAKSAEIQELTIAVKAANERADKLAAELANRPVGVVAQPELVAPAPASPVAEPSHDVEEEDSSPEVKRGKRKANPRDSIRVTPAKVRKSEAPAVNLDFDPADMTVAALKAFIADHKIPGAPIQTAKKPVYVDLVNKWKASKAR